MIVTPTHVNDFELVIGFVAPIGTDLDTVIGRLQQALSVHGYDNEVIRLSGLLNVDRTQVDSVGYFKAGMDKGDELRSQYQSGDVVAALAVAQILSLRGKNTRDRRHAFVLRTLKHPEEIALLRQTYGTRFLLVSVFDGKESRAEYLGNKLKDESPRAPEVSAQVASLIDRDETDANNKFGQHVRDAFSAADYFITLGPGVEEDVDRLVGLMFGEPFLTPTRDEVAMFHAFGSSLRSSDPGRQVGAVIATSNGDILATGSNEVPRAGGGEYWPGDAGDTGDARDFKKGYDFNKRQSRRAVKEFMDALASESLLSTDMSELSSEERVQLIFDSPPPSIKQSRIMSLIEFGRIVHAEMAALMQAARSTVSVEGSTLYTTAFPCHMCMRLIISAGVSRVVYVDPYPKSLAYEMYGDSIVFGPSRDGRVATEPYLGASWNMFPSMFEATNRGRDPDGTFVGIQKGKMRMTLAAVEPLINAEFLEDQIPYALSEAEAKFE